MVLPPQDTTSCGDLCILEDRNDDGCYFSVVKENT